APRSDGEARSKKCGANAVCPMSTLSACAPNSIHIVGSPSGLDAASTLGATQTEPNNANTDTFDSRLRRNVPRLGSKSISSHMGSPHQFFVTRMPINLGSVRKTFVVKPESSLLRNAPVIAVVLNTFLSYSITCQPS